MSKNGKNEDAQQLDFKKGMFWDYSQICPYDFIIPYSFKLLKRLSNIENWCFSNNIIYQVYIIYLQEYNGIVFKRLIIKSLIQII